MAKLYRREKYPGRIRPPLYRAGRIGKLSATSR